MATLKEMIKYTKHLNLLYVEDDLALVEANKALFENYFLHVDIAHNGQEGLSQYKAFYTKTDSYYDLVISDINMPIKNGLEMLTDILKINDSQSTMIISAYDDSQHLRGALKLGIDSFIAKPMQIQKLIDALYKISQAINDHTFVIKHIDTIENLNMQLEQQNKELLAKNQELEKSFRMLDTMVNKEQIVHDYTQDIAPTTMSNEDILMQEQIECLVNDDLPQLVEIHETLDVTIITIVSTIHYISVDSLRKLAIGFHKYASILSIYNFFDELSGVMKDFSRTLENNQKPDNQGTIEGVFMLLESFIFVLGKWQNDLALGDKNKINSLDASMISDMHTITNMWTQKEEESAQEDLDDIFDF